MAVADRRIVVAGTLLRRRMALVQLPDLTVQMLTVLMVAVQPPEAVLGRQTGRSRHGPDDGCLTYS